MILKFLKNFATMTLSLPVAAVLGLVIAVTGNRGSGTAAALGSFAAILCLVIVVALAGVSGVMALTGLNPLYSFAGIYLLFTFSFSLWATIGEEKRAH